MDQELVAAEVHGEIIQVDPKTQLSHHARFRDDGMSIEYEQDPTLHEWILDFQRSVVDIWDIRMWRLGYMMLEGERRFGEDAACVLDPDQFHEVTYRKARYICSRFPPERVRHGLSFSHHEAVAKFDPTEQDMWLDRASEGNWTRDELRQKLRDCTPYEEPLPQPQWSEDASAEEPTEQQEIDFADELPPENTPEYEAVFATPTVFARNGRILGVFLPYDVYLDIEPHLPHTVAQALHKQRGELLELNGG